MMARQHAVLALAFVCLLHAADAASWYVDSAIGNDKFNGTSPQFPWKTLKQVTDVQWWTPPLLKAGDTIYLKGNFTGGFNLNMGLVYGTAAQPITITSLDPSKRATIYAQASNGIGIWDIGTPRATMGYRITDLNIVGDGKLGERTPRAPASTSGCRSIVV